MSTPTLLTRSADTTTEVNVKRRTLRVIANDDTLDRHGTVIQPRGIGLDSYRAQGGPILFDHGHDPNRGAMPVGNGEVELGTYKGKDAVIATVSLWDDEFSEKLWRAYSKGLMRSWSVGMVAISQSPPTKDEVRSRPELEGCSTIYRRSDLLEINCDGGRLQHIRLDAGGCQEPGFPGISSIAPG